MYGRSNNFNNQITMKYYISDLHFGHDNIIKFCNRPWANSVDMDKALIENWNKRITRADDVYILGDTAFKPDHFINCLKQLNGNKHMLMGNHDPGNIERDPEFNKLCILHPLIHTIKDNGRKVVLCHYPIYEWEGFYHNAYHLHGHTHGTIGRSFRPRAYDVSVDLLEYEPKTLDEIKQLNLVDAIIKNKEDKNEADKG